MSMSRQTAARPAAALGGRAGWSIRWVMGGGGGPVGVGGEVTGVGRYCPMGCGRQAAARPGGAASGGRAGRFRSMSMAAGRRPAEGTAKASPYPSDRRPIFKESAPFDCRSPCGTCQACPLSVHPPNPLVKPLSHPRTPARTRKTPPPRPASRARPPPPPPASRTRSVSTPEGRVRKMIPVSVCGASRPEVLWLLHYPASVRQGQYPCGRIRRIFLSFP